MVVREHRKRKNRHQTAAPARFQAGYQAAEAPRAVNPLLAKPGLA